MKNTIIHGLIIGLFLIALLAVFSVILSVVVLGAPWPWNM